MTAPHAFDREVLRRTTAPYLLCERARSIPDSVAFRSKHLGIYRERRWRDYAALVAHAARALQTLHIKRGERVAIMGDACEEWMICDLAAQSLGAITYGVYPTASPTEVEYQMCDGGAAIFIAEDQEYVDKILPIADRLPDLRAIVVLDGDAMFNYAHPKLRLFQSLLDSVLPPDITWLETLRLRTIGRQLRFYHLHLRHHRSSQRRACRPRQTLGRCGFRCFALSNVAREAAPNRCFSSHVSRLGPRCCDYPAADFASGSAFR